MPTDPNTGKEEFNAALLVIVKHALKAMSDQQRIEFFSDMTGEYCTSCGRPDPRCQCWNDE